MYQLTFPSYIRQKAIKQRGSKCEKCGRAGFVYAHHILPVKDGGTHKIENLMLLCEDCHDAEHGRTRKKHFDGEKIHEIAVTKITGEVYELEEELANLAAAVRGATLRCATGTDGHWSVAMCLKAQESVDAGQVIKF